MRINIDTGNFDITECILQGSREFFLLRGEDESGDVSDILEIANNLDVPLVDYSVNKYRVGLFLHANWPERHVATLETPSGDRLGIAFSSQALSSADSVLREKRHHNSYGFIALQAICESRLLTGARTAAPTSASCQITDLIPQDTVVAIFDVDSSVNALGQIDWTDFCSNRIASFAKIGLFVLPEGLNNIDGQRSPKAGPSSPLGARILVTTVSANLPANTCSFLRSVFLSTGPYEGHPGFRFFLAYQIFETLMQDVFVQLMMEFTEKSNGMSSSQLKDLIESYQRETKEKKRLKAIFTANPLIRGEAKDLTDACNVLLVRIGEKNQTTPQDAVYAVRNLLFHNFGVAASMSKELEEIAWCLFHSVCALAEEYVIPTVIL
jgi:hypothetical protein